MSCEEACPIASSVPMASQEALSHAETDTDAAKHTQRASPLDDGLLHGVLPPFSAAAEPAGLHHCVLLPQQGAGRARVCMPWVGLGTYKLSNPRHVVGRAFALGYRAIDSAFIYGGEKTEPEVGAAVDLALRGEGAQSASRREELFITTKHWRKFHGFESSLVCLQLSLRRLRLSYVDLWLMHWPGPAWSTMSRRKDQIEEHGAFHYAAAGHEEENLPALRAETWRAMEEALARGQARAIGVRWSESNRRAWRHGA